MLALLDLRPGAAIEIVRSVRLRAITRGQKARLDWLAGMAGLTLQEARPFDEMLESAPGSGLALLSRGLERMAAGNLAGALADLDRALLALPAQIDALTCRANLRWQEVPSRRVWPICTECW